MPVFQHLFMAYKTQSSLEKHVYLQLEAHDELLFLDPFSNFKDIASSREGFFWNSTDD